MLGVAIVGVALSLLAFFFVRDAERQRRALTLEHRATEIANAIEHGFDAPLEVLRSASSFFEASTKEIDRAAFRTFVRAPLARLPFIYALEWIPRVPGPERARYEAAAVADGLADFHFIEDRADGRLEVADVREEYFPLYFMEPLNGMVLGLEETALPMRRDTLFRARDSGDVAVSERLRLVQDDPSKVSVISFAPLYRTTPASLEERRREFRGALAAVLRVRPVVERALGSAPLDVDVALIDEHAAPASQLLFESSPGITQSKSGLAWQRRFELGGRSWGVLVRERVPMERSEGWPVLVIGILVSGLAAVLVSYADAIRGLRKQVRAARKLGQYTLGEKLGEGGMGVVYEAHHALLRRPTALKVLVPERSDDPALARFEREVQLTSGLTHPNTVVVYDYGRTPDGAFYYAMEYLDGLNLDELVRAEPLPPQRAIHLLDQLCASLEEAHSIGLVHRDVKPANVMVCSRGGVPDFVKVLDFGLVKEISGAVDITQSASRAFVGTPLYAAPELILGNAEIDGRADIYSVGAVAYFLLTGEPPFNGTNMVEVCTRHVAVPADAPSTRTERPIPPELDAIILRCLAKKPQERFASMEELRAALAAVPLPAWRRAEAVRWWSERGHALIRERRERTATSERHGVIAPVRRAANA